VTLADWADTQLSDATRILKLVIVFALTVFVLAKAWKSGMGLAAILVALTTGAVLYYALIGGGIEDFGRLIHDQAANTSK
jgi:hypothetical protein